MMPTIRANSDVQLSAIRSNSDIVILTGSGGSGKSASVCLTLYECLTIPNYSAIVFLKNIGDFNKEGSLLKEFLKFYPIKKEKDKGNSKKGYIGTMTTSSDNMKITFLNGSSISFMHLADETKKVIDERAKSIQVDKILFDECQRFQWYTISTFSSRMRTSIKTKKQIYLSQNPNRDCFNFHFCGDGARGGGWFSCETGEVFYEKNGKVRYVFMDEGGKLENCVWGDTKAEVYTKAKYQIDNLYDRYKHMEADKAKFITSLIKQITFFTFLPSDNKDMLEKNPDYLGTLITSSVSKGMALPNWLHTADEEEELARGEVSESTIMSMFTNEPKRDWKRRIVVDWADEGKDNLTMGYFEGCHLTDLEYSKKNTYSQGVKIVRDFLAKHNLDERSLIIDVQGGGGGSALKDAFPYAIHWSGSRAATKRSKGTYQTIKPEAADMLVLLMNNGLITIDNSLANKRYYHQRTKTSTQTIAERLVFESRVLQFKTNSIGKRALLEKSEQHKILKNQSPDIIDLLIMFVGGNLYDCYRLINDKQATTGLNLGGMYSIFSTQRNAGVNVPYIQKIGLKNIASTFAQKMGW